jgi:hypothetical protein
MKINEALARIDAEWVRKPKGFRVRFDVYVDGRWQADCSPEENTAPLDSDVTAWRLAWKLAQAGRPLPPDFRDGDLANITVVDDQGDRVRSYMTNAFEMYHPHELKSGG